MTSPLSPERRELLVALESIVGNEFYNGHIQNYGPGGIREAEGRGLRYPITFVNSDGSKIKFKERAVPRSVPTEILQSGHYSLGANRLDVMSALDRVIQYLEKYHAFRIQTPGQQGQASDPKA